MDLSALCFRLFLIGVDFAFKALLVELLFLGYSSLGEEMKDCRKDTLEERLVEGQTLELLLL